MHTAFQARKEQAESRTKALKAALERHRRLNRALRVGRVPAIVIEILQALTKAGIAEHFRVVGTHALYAYETAASVRLPGEVTTTLDIDLLWDTRKRVTFASSLAASDGSMIRLLRKVDDSFRIKHDQKYTAMNKDGFQVDILRREQAEDDPHPVQLSADEDDFWVVQARRASDLLNAPSFSEVIVGTNGTMARMDTLHPAVFAQFKRWMAEQPDREPVKRQRDLLQAKAVEWLIEERLPHLAAQASR